MYSNSIPTRDQESPDLLQRCQTVFSDSEFVNDSPTNLTDIIISDDADDDDDDRKSFNSDVTIVLEPDIIIDYVRIRSPFKENASPICNNSPTKAHEDTITKTCFIRCKPLDELLPKNNVSPSPVVNSTNNRINNETDHGKTSFTGKNVLQKLKNNQELIEKSNIDDSDSSSSSVVPPTPSPKRVKRRRIIVFTDSDSTNNSDITLYNISIAKPNTQPKPTTSQGNVRSKLPGNNYYHFMKTWSMHEAAPPTSDSDSNDHNFERKKPQSSTKIRKKQNCQLNTRLAKSNAKSKIQKVFVKKKNIDTDSSDDDDDNDDDVYKNNRIKQKDDSESSDDENLNHKRVMKFCWEWMSKYSYIEKQIRRSYNIPAGTMFHEWEQIGMIWWLIQTKNVYRADRRETWAQMINEGYLKHRTMRSLTNHFNRKILPNLHRYSLPRDIMKKFNKIKSRKMR